MYSLLPPRWRLAIKATISTAWALVGMGGIAAAFIPPNPFVIEWGPVIPSIMGTLLLVASVLAVLGVTRDRYRWEWIASWVAGGCLALYVLTIWWLFATGAHERLTTALFTSALLVCVISRSVTCAAHAARLRAEYLETIAHLRAMEEFVDGAD